MDYTINSLAPRLIIATPSGIGRYLAFVEETKILDQDSLVYKVSELLNTADDILAALREIREENIYNVQFIKNYEISLLAQIESKRLYQMLKESVDEALRLVEFCKNKIKAGDRLKEIDKLEFLEYTFYYFASEEPEKFWYYRPWFRFPQGFIKSLNPQQREVLLRGFGLEKYDELEHLYLGSGYDYFYLPKEIIADLLSEIEATNEIVEETKTFFCDIMKKVSKSEKEIILVAEFT